MFAVIFLLLESHTNISKAIKPLYDFKFRFFTLILKKATFCESCKFCFCISTLSPTKKFLQHYLRFRKKKGLGYIPNFVEKAKYSVVWSLMSIYLLP